MFICIMNKQSVRNFWYNNVANKEKGDKIDV